MWQTLRNVPRIIPQQASQPSTITRKLKSFQLEGLHWMTRQEQSEWKGGLLGDEMGMGKTIQAVSLIMSDYPAADPTLVVVPPVALMQWQNEIAEYTNGKLKVLVFHNTNPKVKNLSLKELKSHDIIMISYSGLESIHRKESKGWKRDDGLVKENSKIHAINYHRLILDEAHSIKSRTTGGKGNIRQAIDPIANPFFSRQGLLCAQGRLQVVSFRHASTKSYWRVLLVAAFSSDQAFCMLFL